MGRGLLLRCIWHSTVSARGGETGSPLVLEATYTGAWRCVVADLCNLPGENSHRLSDVFECSRDSVTVITIQASYGHRSRQSVSTIDQDITPSRISARPARQVQIQPLDLLDMPLPPQHRHPVCFVLYSCASRAHLGVEEARRHHVDPGKVAPLTGEGLAEVGDESFGRVVDGLVLGYVDDVRGHAGGNDQVAGGLAFEEGADVFGAVDNSIDYNHGVSKLVRLNP